MTGPDYPHLERVVTGPEYPIRSRDRSGMVVVWLAAIVVIVAFVLSVAAAASRWPAEHSSPSSPAEPAGGAGRVARTLLGTPHSADALLVGPSVDVHGGVPPTTDRYRGTAIGEASWYDDGPGLYGAVHSWRFGDDPYWVEVCRQDASATCVLVVVRDHMANDERAIDLGPDAFVRLWPGLGRRAALDRGVVDVTVRDTGASATLPPTEVLP